MTLGQEILIKEAGAREEGRNDILVELVKDGIMPSETAAQCAGKRVDDFKDQLMAADIPTHCLSFSGAA